MSHTKGPWSYGLNVKGPGGETICDVHYWMNHPGLGESNARLIAAAPMLLEACERFAGYQGVGQKVEDLAFLRAAIKAAKGEE